MRGKNQTAATSSFLLRRLQSLPTNKLSSHPVVILFHEHVAWTLTEPLSINTTGRITINLIKSLPVISKLSDRVSIVTLFALLLNLRALLMRF